MLNARQNISGKIYYILKLNIKKKQGDNPEQI